MAVIIETLNDFVSYVNSLLEGDDTAPSEGEEEYTVWTALANVAINLWENEEGILWKELFVKLADAADGDSETEAGVSSYDCPSDFRFPACGYVWIGTGTNKAAYKVISQEEAQLYSNDSGRWCYFLLDGTPTLEFNPNLTMTGSETINYEYYKFATKLEDTTDEFEMSDPMFAVYYALSELRREEGDVNSASIASQKLESMKTKNVMPSWFQTSNLDSQSERGFGV